MKVRDLLRRLKNDNYVLILEDGMSDMLQFGIKSSILIRNDKRILDSNVKEFTMLDDKDLEFYAIGYGVKFIKDSGTNLTLGILLEEED